MPEAPPETLSEPPQEPAFPSPFLVLMRHAAAALATSSDFARPLTEFGRRDATAVGRQLYAAGLVPRKILSSSAPRALESARRVAVALQLADEQVRSTDALYAARPPDMLREIHAAATDRLLVVGHNPTIQRLLEELCDHLPGRETNAKIMRPATAAVLTGTPLDTTGDWAGKLTLHELFRPKAS